MGRRELSGEWAAIRERLRPQALPDSRFDTDLDRFIPAFAGVEADTERVLSRAAFQSAECLFVTPDNSMQHLRWKVLEAGKRLVIPSYGLWRGFFVLSPEEVSKETALFASWGDGIAHFGRPVDIAELGTIGRLDAVVAGAAAVSRNGVRFGMGHRYLDLEWNLFLEAGCLDLSTPVWTIVHDCQVLDTNEEADADNVLVDAVFTPTRVLEPGPHRQPQQVDQSILQEIFGGAPVPPQLIDALVPSGRALVDSA